MWPVRRALLACGALAALVFTAYSVAGKSALPGGEATVAQGRPDHRVLRGARELVHRPQGDRPGHPRQAPRRLALFGRRDLDGGGRDRPRRAARPPVGDRHARLGDAGRPRDHAWRGQLVERMAVLAVRRVAQQGETRHLSACRRAGGSTGKASATSRRPASRSRRGSRCRSGRGRASPSIPALSRWEAESSYPPIARSTAG